METNSNNFSDEEYVSCEYLQSGLNMHTLNISTCNWFTKGLVFYKFNEPIGGVSDPQTKNVDFKKIDKFFETVKKVGCKQVNFSLEFCQAIIYKQGNEIPKNLYGLFDYAQSKAEKAGILYQVYDVVKDLLKKGHY